LPIGLFDIGILTSTLRLSTPLTLGAIGGLYSERGGVMNIALEGIMLFGAFGSAVVAYYSGNPWLGLLFGAVIGMLIAFIHGLVSITFLGDQIVSGMGINILALGLPAVFSSALFKTPSSTPSIQKMLPTINIPLLSDIPVLGEILSGYTIPVYLSFAVVILTYLILFYTVFGLRLRAVGENPKSAESMGVNVIRYKYYGVLLSGLLAGMGGAFLSIGHGTQFIKNMTAGRGYIALAALIFGKWHPVKTFLACLIFGFADALQMRLQGVINIPVQFIQMIPYILTILVIVGFIGKTVPPAASGIPYRKG